jgi:hypothetical protein
MEYDRFGLVFPFSCGYLALAMAIKKQEFYEGAALHLLARTGQISNIRYEIPFFIINNDLSVLLKYCTKSRSPWGFTFTPPEQTILQQKAATTKIVIGLICGADGIAAIDYRAYLDIAVPRDSAIGISCFRHHWEHYEVFGPDGRLKGKVAPSNWQRILGT